MQFPYSFFGGVIGAYVAGYIMGGQSASTSDKSAAIQKMVKSTETFSTISSNIAVVRLTSAGFSSQTHGYCAGGRDTTVYVFAVSKLNFAAETVAGTTNLSVGTGGQTGVNSPVYGYIIGCNSSGPGSARTTQIQRIQLSNDALSLSSSVSLFSLATGLRILAFNNIEKAFTFLSTSSGFSQLQKMSFSTEAVAASTTFSNSLQGAAASMNGDIYGYLFQNNGSNPDGLKVNYATEVGSIFLSTGTLSYNPDQQPSMNFFDSGYIVQNDSVSPTLNAAKLVFATETLSSVSGVQSSTARFGCGNVQY